MRVLSSTPNLTRQKVAVVMSAAFFFMSPILSLAFQKNDISEITLEMSPGSSTTSRAFKITLRRDGTAFYHGEANVKLKGKYKGSISEEDFLRLAAFIEERKF